MDDSQSVNYKLEFLNGPKDGMSLSIVDADVVVGSNDDAAVVIAHDPNASGRHARIRCASHQLTIEDLESDHGTFVNDAKITGSTLLTDDDVVRVGFTEFVCVMAGQAQSDSTHVSALENRPST